MGKLVRGIGVYEVGKYTPTTLGKKNPEYNLWSNVLSRCNPLGVEQVRHPTYAGCTIHPDFIKFQDFAEWCNNQIGFGLDGYQLDKDILVPGNKVYGPDTCAFVPKGLNLLFTHKRVDKGEFPTGVCWNPTKKRFHAQISINGRYMTLGYTTELDAAHDMYKSAKQSEIRRQSIMYKDLLDPRIYHALMNFEVV